MLNVFGIRKSNYLHHKRLAICAAVRNRRKLRVNVGCSHGSIFRGIIPILGVIGCPHGLQHGLQRSNAIGQDGLGNFPCALRQRAFRSARRIARLAFFKSAALIAAC
jgi:hypothetical protein